MSFFTQANREELISQAMNEFRPSRLLPSLIAGLVIGILTVIAQISYAALIFAGDLSGLVSNGIGLMLFGAVVIQLAVSLTSSYSGAIADPQDSSAVILALVAGTIASSMLVSATLEETYLTIVAAIALSSLLTGLFFLALGYFKLGGLVRFLPYPVVGGFLAGTGWLLVTGAIGVMADISPTVSQLPVLFQFDVLIRWLPGLIFAVLLLFALNRYDHFLIMPSMILAAMGLFYLIMWLTNSSVAEASAQGWLMGPFPAGRLWQPFTFSDLAQVHWSVLFEQIGNLAAILIISVVALLINASGIELTVEQDIDLNRELLAAGFGTFGAGLGGGMVGYHTLSSSTLAHTLGASSRLVGLFSAGVCGITLFFGASILALFPKVIMGGLLMLLGLSFLLEWVYEAWFKLSKIDYFIIILILVVISAVGFLEGVGVGILATVILFVVNYSRINVVKHALSGANYQSRVTRDSQHHQILRQKGDELYILQLQGFIFFGTANNLLDQVRQRINDSNLRPLRFIVLDFRQVTGLDATAMFSFSRMKQLIQAQNISLVFTTPSTEIQHQLKQGGFAEEAELLLFPDLDHGLEWCENQMLIAAAVELDQKPQTLLEQLETLLPNGVNIANLLNYLELHSVESGHYLMRQGDPPEALYFVESGQVTAQLEHLGDQPVRLETMSGGRVVGEIGFYLGNERTAAVVTDESSTVYRLSMSTLQKMEETAPDVASTFHQIIIHLLAQRLTHLINTLQALER